MKELLKNLNNEHLYVYSNVVKCKNFIKMNVNFKKLRKREKFLLKFQLFIMKIYLSILNKRIKIVKEKAQSEIKKTKGGKNFD